MIIRPATSGDAVAISQILNGMIRHSLATFTTEEKTVEGILALISERPGAFLVAQSGGIAGFATYGAFRSGPGYAQTVEHTIILADGAQGQGIGRALMQQLETAAGQGGHHVMIAAISGANPRAVDFHRALGFEQTGQMPEVGRKNDQWLDLILMQKTLTAS